MALNMACVHTDSMVHTWLVTACSTTRLYLGPNNHACVSGLGQPSFQSMWPHMLLVPLRVHVLQALHPLLRKYGAAAWSLPECTLTSAVGSTAATGETIVCGRELSYVTQCDCTSSRLQRHPCSCSMKGQLAPLSRDQEDRVHKGEEEGN